MAAAENAAADASTWVTAAGTILGGAIVYCVQVLRGRKAEPSNDKQLILEHADQADLATVKDLAAQLRTMLGHMDDIKDFRDDLEATKQQTLRMSALLERIDARLAEQEKKALSDEAFRRGVEAGRAKREGH